MSVIDPTWEGQLVLDPPTLNPEPSFFSVNTAKTIRQPQALLNSTDVVLDLRLSQPRLLGYGIVGASSRIASECVTCGSFPESDSFSNVAVIK